MPAHAVGSDERVGVLADRPAGVHPDPLARAMPLGVAFGTVAADDGLGRLLDDHGAARAGGCEWQTEDQPAGDYRRKVPEPRQQRGNRPPHVGIELWHRLHLHRDLGRSGGTRPCVADCRAGVDPSTSGMLARSRPPVFRMAFNRGSDAHRAEHERLRCWNVGQCRRVSGCTFTRRSKRRVRSGPEAGAYTLPRRRITCLPR